MKPNRSLSQLYAEMLELQAQFYAPETREVLGALEPFLAASEILEVGCGSGSQVEAMGSLLAGKKYLGIDISSELLGVAQRRNAGRADVKLELCDFMSFNPGRQFGFVLSWAVLQHLPDTDAAMRRFADLLKPDGVVLIYDSNAEEEFISTPDMPSVRGLFASISEEKTDGKRKTHALARAAEMANAVGLRVVLNKMSDHSAADQQGRDLFVRYVRALADLLEVMYGAKVDRQQFVLELEHWRLTSNAKAILSGGSWLGLQKR